MRGSLIMTNVPIRNNQASELDLVIRHLTVDFLVPVRVNVVGLVSHIRHEYFSPRNKCLGNLASSVFQHKRRLQCVLFDMLNKYFIVQIAENTFILHWKRSQNRNIGLPISG